MVVFTMVFFTGCLFNVATGHKSCFCDGTLWYFTQQIWAFIKIGFVIKFFVGLCNPREICVSSMVIHLAGVQEVQLSFHLILLAVCTYSFSLSLSLSPSLPLSLSLCIIHYSLKSPTQKQRFKTCPTEPCCVFANTTFFLHLRGRTMILHTVP